ncbi:AUGMIN subunit 6 isoform X2 [Physcomitrium patens]|uniref:AUGMIN subunit 6 isoform X2 n=1 Tax=Physcomitrium patens TaxID=3218 RepID=UPI000D17A417|nr:AUGMIN subunit 6-like isoform X2 [Physcomitrium patens]|eukprot:XP_024372068.1 AUGMIN subunit 6-like isoform X2 [Physcomitrella patens]
MPQYLGLHLVFEQGFFGTPILEWASSFSTFSFQLSEVLNSRLSQQDFAGVWPICDAAQSRDFRKIVQNLINELESQGALPHSNSRVSSLATCCGQRFVELLWQLSAHALREVHRRTFLADVASNPLPAPLAEIVAHNMHAASLLNVTKARIALERRKFLEDAATAVRRQGMWSNMAHEITAEYRSLCAEEAFLNQELGKVQESGVEFFEAREGTSSNAGEATAADVKSMTVDRASQIWRTLLDHSEQSAKATSGPIEDLIAQRKHRFRIDGTLLRAAMDQDAGRPCMDSLSCDTRISWHEEYQSQPASASDELCNNDKCSKQDERNGKDASPLDVSEVLRRWTHALKRIHKQALRLAQTNNGAGPEILAAVTNLEENAHACAVRATLAEHKEHLENVEVLMDHVKSSMPGMKAAIASLSEEADCIECAASSAESASPMLTSTSLARRSDRCLVSSRSIAAQIEQDNAGVDLANVAEIKSDQAADSYGLVRSRSLKQDKYPSSST